MPEVVQEYPGLIMFAVIVGLLLYGSYGGVKAFCDRFNICLEDRRVRLWKLAFVVTAAIMIVTLVAVISGLFLNLLGLVGIFALSYMFVSLVIPALSRSSRAIRRY